MPRFFVSGLINIETTLAVEGFPIHYYPVTYPFNGIQTTVSGVGFNVAKALTTLGNRVDFASLIGPDANGALAHQRLQDLSIPDAGVLDTAGATAQSVILYDPVGRRQIHVDLKDIQESNYPVEKAKGPIHSCDLAVICNINFSRPLLKSAREAGKWIATDVHALSNLDDDYNRDFMAQSQILFLSDESLPESPENMAEALLGRYGMQILVIGLGDKGALLAVRQDDFMARFKAVRTRPVKNTIGAGDALFSAFLDDYARTKDPYASIQAALVFASYKIGDKGAADGFLTREDLDRWIEKVAGDD